MEKKLKIVTPVYQQIAADIASKIVSGHYRPNEKIYARSSLASQYGVSAETARRAICVLSDMDIVDTAKGSGVVIKSKENALRFVKQFENVQTVNDLKKEILESISRQKTLPYPTHLAKDLSAAAMELIGASWNPRAPIRLISLTGTSLVPEDSSGEQLCFFGGDSGARDRQEKLEAALDGIRNRFGKGAVSSGGLLNDDIGAGGIRHEYPEKGSKNV